MLKNMLCFCHTGQQCPVTQPTITAYVICPVSPPPSQGPPWGLSYTCNDPGDFVIWSSSFISGDFGVTYMSGESIPSLTVRGVYVIERHTSDSSCINSTLTFTGTNLTALNGTSLNCKSGPASSSTIRISIPGENSNHNINKSFFFYSPVQFVDYNTSNLDCSYSTIVQ